MARLHFLIFRQTNQPCLLPTGLAVITMAKCIAQPGPKREKKKTLQVLLQVSLGRGKPGTNCKKKKKKKETGDD